METELDRFNKRLSRVETQLRKSIAAPTIPNYDLNANLGFAAIDLGFASRGELITFIPNHEYLLEAHFVAGILGIGHVDWYLDGSLIRSDYDFFGSPTDFINNINLGTYGNQDGTSLVKTYYWDFKIGSSRGASDRFSFPFTVVPTTSNGWSVGTAYPLTQVNIVTINSHLALEMKFDLATTRWIIFAKNLEANLTDCWFSINFMGNIALKTEVEAFTFVWNPVLELRRGSSATDQAEIVSSLDVIP